MMGIHRVPFTGASWLLPARDVRVWTPPSYYEQPERRFPVVYAYDGQWLMAPGYKSWSLQHTLTSLIAQGAIEEPIVVMIESVPSDQLGDVGPDFLPLFRRRWMEYNVDLPGPGQAYLSYMCDELKPSIDKRFRTRPGPVDTHALGSSMGGLCAFLSLWRRPDVFGNAACLSPVLQPPLIADVVARAGERFGGGGVGGPACRLYIDNGGDTDEQRVNLLEGMNEGGYWWLDTSLQPGVEAMEAALRWHLRQSVGCRLDLLVHREPGGRHTEIGFGSRADRPLLHLLRPRELTRPSTAASSGRSTLGRGSA